MSRVGDVIQSFVLIFMLFRAAFSESLNDYLFVIALAVVTVAFNVIWLREALVTDV